MATQKGLCYRGTRGGLIYYPRRNGFYIRSKPVSVKQTTATRASATRFGLAVRTSKYLRQALAPVLPVTNNMQVVHGFNRAVYKFLIDYSNQVSDRPVPVGGLKALSFTSDNLVIHRLKLPLVISPEKDGRTVVSFPAKPEWSDFVKPVNAVSVRVEIVIAFCSMPECLVQRVFDTVINVNANSSNTDVHEFVLPVSIPPNSLVVAAGSLKYLVSTTRGNVPLNKAAWMPAGIMDAMYVPLNDSLPAPAQMSR